MKCRATKRWLKNHGIPFKYVNVDTDAEGYNLVAEIGALEVPVVMVDEDGPFGEDWWSGHREPRLEELAEALELADAA